MLPMLPKRVGVTALQVIACIPLNTTSPPFPSLFDPDGSGSTGTHESALLVREAVDGGCCCCIVDLWSSLQQPYLLCLHVMKDARSSSSSRNGCDSGWISHILRLSDAIPAYWSSLQPPLMVPVTSDDHGHTMYQVIGYWLNVCMNI
jgi:hypothetical protein